MDLLIIILVGFLLFVILMMIMLVRATYKYNRIKSALQQPFHTNDVLPDKQVCYVCGLYVISTSTYPRNTITCAATPQLMQLARMVQTKQHAADTFKVPVIVLDNKVRLIEVLRMEAAFVTFGVSELPPEDVLPFPNTRTTLVADPKFYWTFFCFF